jgi:hypothetical protein
MDSGNNGEYRVVFDGKGQPGVLGYNVRNLTTGRSYRFKMRAINFNGESDDSGEEIFYTCLSPT